MKVILTSEKHNEHCDLYPKDSLQDGYYDDKGRFKIDGRIDFIYPHFPTAEIDPNTKTRKCDKCSNNFILEAEFVNDTCKRCCSRYGIIVPRSDKPMEVNDLIQAYNGEWFEVKTILKTMAIVYQLDEQQRKIPKFRDKGRFVMGRLTINK